MYAGDKMLESEAVRKIGFTGSTNVGKTLMAGAAQTVKKVSLELGGNAPYIIFDDADIELAATGVVSSAFRNAGQTCICANKILVQVSKVISILFCFFGYREQEWKPFFTSDQNLNPFC